jgi:hypothetical protein
MTVTNVVTCIRHTQHVSHMKDDATPQDQARSLEDTHKSSFQETCNCPILRNNRFVSQRDRVKLLPKRDIEPFH